MKNYLGETSEEECKDLGFRIEIIRLRNFILLGKRGTGLLNVSLEACRKETLRDNLQISGSIEKF